MKYISKLRVKRLLMQYAYKYPEHAKVILEIKRDLNQVSHITVFEIIYYTVVALAIITLIILMFA